MINTLTPVFQRSIDALLLTIYKLARLLTYLFPMRCFLYLIVIVIHDYHTFLHFYLNAPLSLSLSLSLTVILCAHPSQMLWHTFVYGYCTFTTLPDNLELYSGNYCT